MDQGGLTVLEKFVNPRIRRGEAKTPKVLANFCQKVHENERNWTESGPPPPDPKICRALAAIRPKLDSPQR